VTKELYWLTLSVLMTALFWPPYVLDRMIVRGLMGTMAAAVPESGKPQSPWAERGKSAHWNAVENLAIFAPAVLTAHLLNISTPGTQFAVVLYFFARLVHFVVYTLGVPVARTLAFTAGWIAQIIILISILKWI
jgi:uncharacterized MAPEG superfamily protein